MDRFRAGEWGHGLLLEYVFLEVVNVLLRKKDLATTQQVARSLLDAEDVQLLPCSEIFLETLAAFHQQQDTKLSFVDLSLMVAAHKYAAGNIATFDKEFRRISGVRVYPE